MPETLAPRLWAPRFRSLRKKVMALPELPDAPLPSSLESVLERLGKHETVIWRFRSFWLRCASCLRPLVWRAVLASVVASLGGLGATYAGMEVIKAGATLSRGLLFACAFFVSSLLGILGAYGADLLRRQAYMTIFSELTSQVLAKIPRLSAEGRGEFSSGNLKVLIASDVSEVCEFFDNLMRNTLPALIHLLLLTPFAYLLGGWPGVVGMAVACLVIPFAGLCGRFAAKYEAQVLHTKDTVTTILGEWIRHVRAVRFLSWQEPVAREIEALVRRLVVVASKGHVFVCALFGMTFTWWMASAASVLVAARFLETPLGAARIFGVTWLIILASRHLMFSANTVRLFVMALPSSKRISKLLQAPENEMALAQGEPRQARAEPVALVFQDVGATLGERKVLEGLNLRLCLGERTALIGKVGCGKTTFLRLLAGLSPCSRGSILVEYGDGSQRNLWEEDVLPAVRGRMAWVPQEPFVSNDTVAANITLGTTEQDAWMAAGLAELEADLALWPEGISTEVGEQGVNLSGGQKQRVNLARALHSRRPFLLLDDPLSAVDGATEARLVESLLSHDGGFLLVSHRVASLSRMDRILVLEDGNIVEDGPPRLLMEDAESSFSRVLRAYEGGET